jgi:hypothetical protein
MELATLFKKGTHAALCRACSILLCYGLLGIHDVTQVFRSEIQTYELA